MNSRGLARTWPLFAALALAACGTDMMDVVAPTQLAAVSPPANATNVDPSAAIRISFTQPMMPGAEAYVAVHQGTVAGPLVAGTWTWSQDRTLLTFTPAGPLAPGTAYAVHLGGGMLDAGGRMMGFEQHGTQMGGRWVTESMMAGTSMMGAGWQHTNGSYGMVFTFTTA